MFKTNDIVRCTDNFMYEKVLTINKKYKIIVVQGDWLAVKDDNNNTNGFKTERFKIDTKYQRKQKLNKIINH